MVLIPKPNGFIDASVDVRGRELRRARRRTITASTLAGFASVFGVFALVQQQAAQKQSIVSMTQTAEANLLVNNQLDAMVEAIRAKKQLKNVWIGKEEVSLKVLGSIGQAIHHNQQGLKESLRLPGTDVIFSPDGKQLATVDDKVVRVWSVATGEVLQTLQGHEDVVFSVVFSPDGKRVATASQDKTARVWRVGDMEDLLAISCDWVRHYLASKPEDDAERHLCKGVRTSNE